MHGARGNDSDQLAIATQRETYVKQSHRVCLSEAMQPNLIRTMADILDDQRGLLKKTCSASAWLTSCFSGLLRLLPSSHSNPSVCRQYRQRCSRAAIGCRIESFPANQECRVDAVGLDWMIDFSVAATEIKASVRAILIRSMRAGSWSIVPSRSRAPWISRSAAQR